MPYVTQRTATRLLEELEKKGKEKRKGRISEVKLKKVMDWETVRKVVELHPAFRDLPEEVRRKVLVEPAETLRAIPWNRRRRRSLEQKGRKAILHLYAGPREGYTLERAVKELGGDHMDVLEIDLQRGPEHDMMSDELYAALLRGALDSRFDAVVGGPNCRTRSVLRHYPLPGGGPRPVRSLEEPFGRSDLTAHEKKAVWEDDVMMWRMLAIYLVAEEVRNAKGGPQVGFVLEQPADPRKYMPGCPTFWGTTQWEAFEEMEGMAEYEFYQGDFGGAAPKPTTLGTNLYIDLPERRVTGLVSRARMEAVDLRESKGLARWAPGLMREVARAILTQVRKQVVKLRKMSWQEHISAGHTPMRRDCRVCQEASGQDRPHRRIRHKHAYCLSLDLVGPLKKGRDIDGRSCKYMLVGAYTWPKNPLKSEEVSEKERDGGGEAGKAKGPEEVKKPDQPGQRPEDYWTTSANGKYVIRVHKSHRKVRFFPDDAPGCPVPVEKLRGRRRTIARTTKDGPLKMFMDDWRNAEKTEKVFEDGSRWAGRTIFQLEGPEEEEPQEEEKEEGDPPDPADPEPPEGIWDFELEELVGEQEDGELEEGDLDEHEEDEEKREEPLEIEIHTLAVPLSTKGGKEVLDAIQTMYLELKRQGFPVARLHSDRGKEFMNHALRRWCFNRDISKTSTAADDWRANGRAEVAIKHLKSRMRRVLFAAEVDGQWWPAAARYVVEKDKRTRQRKEGTIPRFCQEVMVKKRKWKSEELGPRHVKGRYLAPVVDVPNGHAVMREDGTVQVAAYVLHKWKPLPEPVDGWQFVERRGDEGEEREPEEPYRVRRRIRDKTQKKVLEDEGVLVRLRALRATIEEEEKAVTNDEPEVMDIMVKALEGLKREEEELRSSTEVEKDEEQILQTKIVSAKEVEMNLEDWKAPMKKELDTIVEEKGAITRLNPASARELLENNPRVQVLPGKGVFTIKPGRKRKCRLVVCGNYGESHEAMPLFAGGTDVVALRLALKEAAVRGWQGGTVDVKGAFLNAPLQAVDQEGELTVAMRPPAVLVRMGLIPKGELWIVNKAMYGLRQSPRCWSDYRDDEMRRWRINYGKRWLKLEQMRSEPNLWLVKKVEDDWNPEELVGLLLVYVDDFMPLGVEGVPQALMEKIKGTWESSEESWFSEEPVRFCGVNISVTEKGITLDQMDYIKEIIDRNNVTGKSVIPMSKECSEPEAEIGITAEEIQTGQRLVGELIWLVTRSRPDLAYVVSRMSSFVSKAPRWVQRTATQTLRYLNATRTEGILLDKDMGEDTDGRTSRGAGLEVITDASFAPGGEISHGCVMVKWQGSMLAWRSSRQSFPALSTAESELMEMIEGMVLGDSVDALIQEIKTEMDYSRTLIGDNQAAVSLCTGDAGSWRTRHLRLRAFYVRWRVQMGDWRIVHRMGANLVADMGTKCLPGTRLRDLRKMAGLVEIGASKPEEGGALEVDLEQGRAALAILACCMQVQAVAAKEEQVEEEDQGDYNALVGFGILVAIFTALAIKVAAMMKEACEKRIRGEKASIRAMRGHNKMPAGDEEEESEVEASSSSRASASTTRGRSATTGGDGGSEELEARPRESEEEASSSSRTSASTTRGRSATTGGGGGSAALGATPKVAPEALRRQLEKGKGGSSSGKGKGKPIINSPWRKDYARRNPNPPWRNEDQRPADDQGRQLVQIDEAARVERWDIEDEELFFNRKDGIAHRTRECAGSRAEARYVCTWCFEKELQLQDEEAEQSVPVIARDWKPVLTTDYGVRYHYSLGCPTLAATRRWNAYDRCRRCAGVRGRRYAMIPG